MFNLFIKLKYFGLPVASLSGKVLKIELPSAATIEQLINILCDQTENKDIELVKSATIMVNNEKAGKHTILKEDDEVMFLRIIGGG